MKKFESVNEFILTPQTSEATEGEGSSRDEYILKIIDEVFSKEDIELKTDLSTDQIIKITKGQIFAERYNCSIMDKLCNKIMILSVSKNRSSRKEFTEISKSVSGPQEPDLPSIKTRLLGE